MTRTAIGLALGLLVLGCRAGDDPADDVTLTTSAVRYGTAVPIPATLVQKSVVDVNGGCTGTLLRPDWVLTARHCTRGNSSLQITHRPTNTTVTVQSTNFYHPSDLSLDIALLHLPSPIDIDPSDPNPSVIPFFAGTGAELVGQTVEQIGFGNRDMKSLAYCGSDADCPGSDGRCDLSTARPGRSQCYDANRTSVPVSGTCSSKNDCPKGQDCDNDDPNLPGICYEMRGFVNVAGSCSRNSQCGAYNRLCAPTDTGWRCAEPVGCVSNAECPAGYSCVDEGVDAFGIPNRACHLSSIIPSSPTCDMAVSCGENVDCGSLLCIDGHCCPAGRGLRTGDELLSGVYQFSDTIAPAWNRKGVVTPNGPTVQQCLPGDSGGPYFLNGTLAAVVSDGTMHAASFRDWATEVMAPMHSGTLAAGVKERSTFGDGSDPVMVGDFDGDGRADVLTTAQVQAGIWQVSVALSRPNSTAATWTPTGALFRNVATGDYNGDGLDDLYAFDFNSGAVYVGLSNGAAFGAFNVRSPSPSGIDYSSGVVRVADMNGDSYADLVNFRGDGSVRVAFACGPREPGHTSDSPAHQPPPGCTGWTGTFGSPAPWFDNFWQPSIDGKDSVLVGDFNGDGYADILQKRDVSGSGEAFVALTETLPCTQFTDCADHMCIAASGVRTEGINHCRSGYGQKPTFVRNWGSFPKANLVGDFNGDDRDDLGYIGPTGAFTVALSDDRGGRSCDSISQCNPVACVSGYCGYSFAAPVGWGNLGAACAPPALCVTGDRDRDGRDDIFKFFRGTPGTNTQSVWSHRSSAVRLIISFSAAGPISGSYCTLINEPAEPATHAWGDNYLCTNKDIGLVWRYGGTNEALRCTTFNETLDPHTWSDNKLCVPPTSTVSLEFWSSQPPAGKTCVSVNEPADPDSWADNYLCYSE